MIVNHHHQHLVLNIRNRLEQLAISSSRAGKPNPVLTEPRRGQDCVGRVERHQAIEVMTIEGIEARLH